jgi:hypothetical protein
VEVARVIHDDHFFLVGFMQKIDNQQRLDYAHNPQKDRDFQVQTAL